jgi:hypothetical protein
VQALKRGAIVFKTRLGRVVASRSAQVGGWPSDLAVASPLGQEGVCPSDPAAASRLGQGEAYRSLQAAGSAPTGIGAVASTRGKYLDVPVFSTTLRREKIGRLELDNVRAIALRAIDHDAVSAALRRHTRRHRLSFS